MAHSSERPILILGAGGQLGRAFCALLGEDAVPLPHQALDISDRAALAALLDEWSPRSVVNCAAATDVDRCEGDHDYADAANLRGPGHLAELAAERGIRLVHVSTDHVFSGLSERPYAECDPPCPVNYYGLSKLRGEEAVLSALPNALVVRTSWVFGEGGANFPEMVLRWAAARDSLRSVADNWGCPTYAVDLASEIWALVEGGAAGIFHLAGSGCASRLEVAEEVVRLAGIPCVVQPALASEFPLPAPRPARTCLDCSKAASIGVYLPPWRDGLARFIETRTWLE